MASTVLIIDDNEDDILLTKMVLTKIQQSFTVKAASSGEEGLALLRTGTDLPDLILLDLKMPRMGGLDVLGAIREDDRLNRIPVIVVTNSELESDKDASYKAGAAGFLAKSIDLDHFEGDIRHVLNQRLGEFPS